MRSPAGQLAPGVAKAKPPPPQLYSPSKPWSAFGMSFLMAPLTPLRYPIPEVSAADNERLAAVVADRNSPQKHVWRARIILAKGPPRISVPPV